MFESKKRFQTFDEMRRYTRENHARGENRGIYAKNITKLSSEASSPSLVLSEFP
jgi:hypothetical protein